jgi:hypothetical protein
MAIAKLSFRIFKNGQLVRETQLNQGVIKIGKMASAHLHIDDEHVSRMHAIIEVLGDEVSVIDLGSTGGTFVNGQRINKAKLQSGDAITVGESRIEIAIGEPAVVLVSAPVRPPAVPVRPAPTAAMPAATVTLPAVALPPAATRTAKPAIFTAPAAGEVDDGGARAVEVAAMLGDSVVGVKHCMDPRGGKVTPATWGFLAGGVACLLASATAFYTSVDTAARNKGALGVHLSMGKPERAFRPKLVSPGVDVLAFGGLAAGLIGITAALARIRRERRSPFYRIGTAPEVEQPLENAPAASFPLVAPSGDDFVFNYGHGIDGELIVDGKSTPLAELAAQGRSRPSPTTAGAIEVPIPYAARIRARAGQTTFLVTAVAKPRAATTPLFNLERRTLAYGAGSLAVHLGIVAFLGTVPLDDAGVNVDLMFDAKARLDGQNTMPEDPVQEPEQPTDNGKQHGSSVPTTAMALDEGMAGKPSAVRTDGNMEVKNNNADPQFSRQQAIEYARTAGVLGSESAIRGGIAALTANTDFSSGWSDADIYGPLFGSEGEGRGNFGMGRKDWGPGGGCMQEPCGTVGVKWGRIAIDTRPGDNWGGPGGSWGRQRTHTPQVPPPTFSMPSAIGGLDKAIIKRYIKRSVHKIAYCYESELLARPGIEGQVMVSFMITSSGTVQSSAGNGFDAKVSSCVASVIKNIEFPRPTDGGNVQVNYPFTFHATGK